MLTEKTFPIRMDQSTYERLQRQAKRTCMTVTAYIRNAFLKQVVVDESTEKKGGR